MADWAAPLGWRLAILASICSPFASRDLAEAANWSLRRVKSMAIGASESGVEIAEMSGVAYLGESGGGKHRFAAAQDAGGEALFFEVEFDGSGAVANVDGLSALKLGESLDFEGIAVAGPSQDRLFL
ncbi:MAG: hypothetical protein AAF961_00475, partial [Planctomycetota bacterium]